MYFYIKGAFLAQLSSWRQLRQVYCSSAEVYCSSAALVCCLDDDTWFFAWTLQASFEMTFVAKGYSTTPDEHNSAPGGTADGDVDTIDALESAAASPVNILSEPDVTIITRVRGPEPGKSRQFFCCCSLSDVVVLFQVLRYFSIFGMRLRLRVRRGQHN